MFNAVYNDSADVSCMILIAVKVTNTSNKNIDNMKKLMIVFDWL